MKERTSDVTIAKKFPDTFMLYSGTIKIHNMSWWRKSESRLFLGVFVLYMRKNYRADLIETLHLDVKNTREASRGSR